MTVFLVAGKAEKDFVNSYLKKQLTAKDHLIGIDGGILLLLKLGFPVELGVGDLDSLTKSEQVFVKEQVADLHLLPPEKDDTDTQQAFVLACKRYPQENFVLLGGLGGRVDHFLANLYLPLEERFLPYLRQFTFLDQENQLTFYPPGNYQIKKEPQMKYLGYVPLTPVENLTLKKSKYTLEKVTTLQPVAYPSNEFVTNEAEFSFTKGYLLVVQSKDQAKNKKSD